MDNNMINIDDLVRQRLTGGEEREPSGAWMRMRELLDQEEEKKPVGFLWRRLFGGLALLVLVATISLGGYNITNGFRMFRAPEDNGNTAIAAAPAAHRSRTAAASTLQPTPATEMVAASEDRVALKAGTVATTSTQASEIRETAVGSTEVVKKGKAMAKNHVSVTHATDQHPATALNGQATGNDDNARTGHTQPGMQPENADFKVLAAAPVHTTKAIPGRRNGVAVSTGLTGSAGATRNQAIPGNVAGGSEAGIAGKKGGAADMASHRVSGRSHSKSVPVTTQSVRIAADQHTVQGAIEPAVDKAPASSPSSVADGQPGPSFTDNKEEVPVASTNRSAHKAPQAAARTTGNNRNNRRVATQGASTGITIAPSLAATVSTRRTKPADKLARSLALAAGTPAGSSRASGRTSAPVPAASAAASGVITGRPVSLPRETRRVERISIRQVYVRTPKNTWVLHLDTVSMEMGTEEIAFAQKPNVTGPPQTLEELVDDQTDMAGSGNVHPLLAANSGAAEKSDMGKSNGQHGTGKGGGGALSDLPAAFNDLKMQLGPARLSMGLAAGVNSTFFAPNSFKGFHFGVTATVMLGANLGFIAELKYFQRINNNFTLNDNFYTYTPNTSGGGYQKELMQNPYSFSTLHSFEMPLMVRYGKGSFSFFGGVNLAYSFAINEAGGYPMPDPNNITNVPVISNDQAPKLQAGDFGSRFGVGYLFGLGVQLSQSLSLDVRDVQTFWDNAPTSGAKEISNQLYMTPSIQVSLGYRFGGKKNNSKE